MKTIKSEFKEYIFLQSDNLRKYQPLQYNLPKTLNADSRYRQQLAINERLAAQKMESIKDVITVDTNGSVKTWIQAFIEAYNDSLPQIAKRTSLEGFTHMVHQYIESGVNKRINADLWLQRLQEIERNLNAWLAANAGGNNIPAPTLDSLIFGDSSNKSFINELTRIHSLAKSKKLFKYKLKALMQHVGYTGDIEISVDNNHLKMDVLKFLVEKVTGQLNAISGDAAEEIVAIAAKSAIDTVSSIPEIEVEVTGKENQKGTYKGDVTMLPNGKKIGIQVKNYEMPIEKREWMHPIGTKGQGSFKEAWLETTKEQYHKIINYLLHNHGTWASFDVLLGYLAQARLFKYTGDDVYFIAYNNGIYSISDFLDKSGKYLQLAPDLSINKEGERLFASINKKLPNANAPNDYDKAIERSRYVRQVFDLAASRLY